MTRWLVLTVIVLAVVVLGGCGAKSKLAASSKSVKTTASGALLGSVPAKGDEDDDDLDTERDFHALHDPDADFDEDKKNAEMDRHYYDYDDQEVLRFGHQASPAEARELSTVVERYFTAVGAGDGKTACSLLYVTLADAVPEDYGAGAGPAYARGKTCAAVMSKLFTKAGKGVPRGISIVGVRVEGKTAHVMLNSTTAAMFMPLRREHGRWKIETLVGSDFE